jgi:hypothetical protein
MSCSMPMEVLSGAPNSVPTVEAATPSDATASAGASTSMRMHTFATSAPNNGAAMRKTSYSRRKDGKYRGIFRDIMTKLRAGTTLCFSAKELTNIMCVMSVYKNHVIAYKKLLTLGKRFGCDMAAQIMRLEHGSDIAVNYRELQEKKTVMNEKISHLLAIKAEKMLKYSSSYRRQFGPSRKYYGLKPYFRLQALNDPNLYWSHYIVVSRMVSDFVTIRENQQHRWDQHIAYYANHDDYSEYSEEEECRWCGGYGPGCCRSGMRERDEEDERRQMELDQNYGSDNDRDSDSD